MSPLRSRFIDALRLNGFSERTVRNYVDAVAGLSSHCGRSPLELFTEQIRSYLLHRLRTRKHAPRTVNLALAPIATFFRLLAPDSTVMRGIERVKLPTHIGAFRSLYCHRTTARRTRASFRNPMGPP